MRLSSLRRALLAGATLVLLLAPLSQAADRHDRFTPRDAELNLIVLAALATAGYWAFQASFTAPRATPALRPNAPSNARAHDGGCFEGASTLGFPTPSFLLRV